MQGPVAPFTLALALLAGLLGLELIGLLLGTSFLGSDSDADLGLDAPDAELFDVDMVDLDAMDLDAIDLDMVDPVGSDLADHPEAPNAPGAAGLLGWLGLGRVPMLIWLASLLFGFGMSGVVLQSVLSETTGVLLPAWQALIPAAITGVLVARGLGGAFARLLPKAETQSLSERHLGRRRGVVTTGTAARGRPAEVRVTDGFGNLHYLRAEPLRDDVTIRAGTEVLVLRARDGLYRIVDLSQA